MGCQECIIASKNINGRAPYAKPPFTISDIKKAIPPHCFQPSLIRSFSYVFSDLALVYFFYFIASNYIPVLPSTYRFLAWPIYWVFQGSILFGIWVLGHDCSHYAFSEYKWLDDTVGFFLQTPLLIPFFSWKFSHRRHHTNTNCLEKDEAFVPTQKSQLKSYSKYVNNPPGRLVILFITFILGWPMYLAFNAAGRPYDRLACHYDPYGPIFNERERIFVFISDAGLVVVLYVLHRVALIKGLAFLMCIYGVPVLVHNAFLVLTTYLHHTHPALPHYDLTEWDWLRGSLATADRDYGLLNKVFHNLTDTHVLHHLFSNVPHYHAMEATNAMKPILGEFYRFDDTPILEALWRETKECLYVEPDGDAPNKGVYWFKNKY